jgi:hypothetical protein
VIYFKRRYGKKKKQKVWYLLTDLCDANEVLNLYKRRWEIEAMFKDYKTGGYNIEEAKMKEERLEKILILIAITYTIAVEKGGKSKVVLTDFMWKDSELSSKNRQKIATLRLSSGQVFGWEYMGKTGTEEG